MLAESGVLVTC